MTDPESWPPDLADQLRDLRWPEASLDEMEDHPGTGLVTLGYLRAAIRRGARWWLAGAMAGLLIGAGFFVRYPPAYHATTSVLINDGPNADPPVAIVTDAAIAGSNTVAAAARRRLGLTESVLTFKASYSVAMATQQLLWITASGRSPAAAVHAAAAVAAAYLRFREQNANQELAQAKAGLAAQLGRARQAVTAAGQRLAEGEAAGDSAAMLSQLRSEQSDAKASLVQVSQYVTTQGAADQAGTVMIISGSKVVDQAAIVPHSRAKAAILYVVGGLMGGAVLAIIVLLVIALVSDRVRYRDDVAVAAQVPVRLSTGPASGLTRRGGAMALRRVIGYLHGVLSAVPSRPGAAGLPDQAGDRSASLALVAVDNDADAAAALTGLATELAQAGRRALIADFSQRRLAASALGVSGPGAHPVERAGAAMMVLVPAREGVVPAGPDDCAPGAAAARTAAEVVLTLVSPDPQLGIDRLGAWAGQAVLLVTAGRSTAARIRAAAEMVRFSDTPIQGVILIGADRADATTGMVRAPDPAARPGG